jgi:hypothetical protein
LVAAGAEAVALHMAFILASHSIQICACVPILWRAMFGVSYQSFIRLCVCGYGEVAESRTTRSLPTVYAFGLCAFHVTLPYKLIRFIADILK